MLDPATKRDERVNLWVKDGVIEFCEPGETQLDSDTETINADSLVAAPGFIDMSSDFGDRGYEYKEGLLNGAKAAVNGGFTDVVISPNTDPVIDNGTVIEYIKNKTFDLPVSIHCAGAVTKELKGEHITQMLEMNDHGAVYFTNADKSIPTTQVLKRAFDYASSKDLLIAEHAEDKSLADNSSMNESALSHKLGLKGFPHIAEEIIVSRDILMAEYCGNRRLHFKRISTAYSTELIREAKNRELRISAETSPHYFYFDQNKVTSFKTYYKVNPPLREKDDINALIKALKENVIEVITSDHKPAALHEKDVEFENAPYGINGMEATVGLSIDALYHKNKMELIDVVAKFTSNPRKLMKLDQVSFDKGSEAKITILDPEKEWIYSKENSLSSATNNPYEHMKIKGKPEYVINGVHLFKSVLGK